MKELMDFLLGPSMPPHGHCYLWNDNLVAAHVVSDSLIVFAYFTIPVALVYLVKKREDLSFNYMFYLFGIFIFACGATHLVAIYNVWHGAYWLSAGVKVITAVASVGTAILVWPLIPKALALPSNSALREVNERLQSEVATTADQRRELQLLSTDLERLVAERTAELSRAKVELEERVAESERANRELQDTLLQLQLTQRQLVETEKMASLGELVAGVAHEINTPIGVGVTAASTLRGHTESLVSQCEAGALTRSQLDKYLQRALQTSDIILANLGRAAELIHSFKQVAVDRASVEFRRFNVKSYIDEILLSLRPKLKNSGLQLRLVCDPDIEIRSYPGALSQILTNLVINAQLHAYDEGERGELLIEVQRQGDGICLRVQDHGRGIPPENLPRIYDPFFTTRRGKGGSGLGMHIVFNLVTQQLGGRIDVRSELGKGTTVEVEIPSRELVAS